MLKFISILPDVLCGIFWGVIKVFAVYWMAYICGIAAVFGFFYILTNIFF